MATLSVALLIPVLTSAIGIQVIVNGQSILFKDVAGSAWYATYIHDAAEAGIVNGYMDASGHYTEKFGPQDFVTVAEALKIALESSGYNESAYGSAVDSGMQHWAAVYFSVAKGENFPITDIYVGPDRHAKRAEVASILASAFRVKTDSTPSGTTFGDVRLSTKYGTSIEALARDGVVSGDTDMSGQVKGTFRPLEAINRAEVVKMAMLARAKYGQPGKDRLPMEQSNQTVIDYRDSGFSPSVLRITKGTTVTFHNNSAGQLWIASGPHPTHADYPEFNSHTALQAGQEYKFTFTRVGTWSFHNHLSPSETGTISVE